MKKLFIITLLLIGKVTFGQKVKKNYVEDPKKEAERIYKILDSVSKVYKKDIVMFGHTITGNTESVHFNYYKNGKLRDTTIIVDKTPLKTKKKVETKPKDMERDANYKLDSLSKVYKMKIYNYGTITEDGVTRHFVTYLKGDELVEKRIPKPVK